MSGFRLSKTEFVSGVQCPKMLWLQRYQPECADPDAVDEQLLENGKEVGKVARDLLGEYALVPPGSRAEKIAETQRLLKAGTPVIAEASFAYEGCFCSVDLLACRKTGEVEIYEVKSASKVQDIHIWDVAYQYYVLTSLDYRVSKVSVVTVDTGYVREGELDLNELFWIQDVTAKAIALQQDVESRIAVLRELMEQPEEPACALGLQCSKPYNCAFFAYCTKDLPHPNVFDLAGMWMRDKIKLLNKGVCSFEELEGTLGGAASSTIQGKCFQQVRHELHPQLDEIRTKAIATFLSYCRYPLYFLDFESYNAPIPEFDNASPYEQIPFQYSLHWIEEEGGELKHTEFLAYPGGDPRRALAERLCADIPEGACVLAYNMSFEVGRIRRLAELYPDLAHHLLSFRIADLMVPFRDRDYYTRAMQGSYSIKYVLPALFPDDPELDYHNLEGVHNGSEASAAFREMAALDPETLEERRAQLLKYCGLDTYAMVKVWRKLCEVAGPVSERG